MDTGIIKAHVRSIMGTKKTVVFVSLVIVMATVSGLIFGSFF